MGTDAHERDQTAQELAVIGASVDSFRRPLANVRYYLSPRETPSAKAGEPWQWVESDHNALNCVVAFEQRYQPFVIPDQDVAVRPTRRLELGQQVAECIGRYHAALPYSEAERRVITEVFESVPFSQAPGLYDRDRHAALEAAEVVVTSEGLRRVVQGRDLTRRWWSWRRQTDEFAGQGSLDMAREAVEEACDLLFHPERHGFTSPPPPSHAP